MADKALMALGPAFVAALLVMLIAWPPWIRERNLWGGAWGGALALGAAFVTSFLSIVGWPGIPPAERWQWLLPLAGASAAIGVAAGCWRRSRMVQVVLGLALAAAVAWIIHPPPAIEPPWAWRIGLGVISLLMLGILEPIAARRPGPVIPLSACIAFAGTSVVVLESGNALLALIAAAGAAGLGAIGLVSLINRTASLAHGGTFVIAAMLTGLIGIGWFYDPRSPRVSYILLLCSPAAIALAELFTPQRMKPIPAAILRIVISAIPTAAAITTLFLSNRHDSF